MSSVCSSIIVVSSCVSNTGGSRSSSQGCSGARQSQGTLLSLITSLSLTDISPQAVISEVDETTSCEICCHRMFSPYLYVLLAVYISDLSHRSYLSYPDWNVGTASVRHASQTGSTLAFANIRKPILNTLLILPPFLTTFNTSASRTRQSIECKSKSSCGGSMTGSRSRSIRVRNVERESGMRRYGLIR